VGGQTRDPALEILDALATRYAFRDVAALVERGACRSSRAPSEAEKIQQLCVFGQRLLDLDAEDFGEADSAANADVGHAFADQLTGEAVPERLVARSLGARMPQSPREVGRGALATLRPAFSLLLEVIAVRWMRREMSALVAALHITSEYLPMLIWEPVLGHAGDPARMPVSVGGKDSRWGKVADRECPHSMPEKAAADRALRVSAEPDRAWRAYLDRQHSTVSTALAICAAECRTRCTVITRWRGEDQDRLAKACKVAEEFTGSALIRLRHSAPVGHGFGVPSPREVLRTWAHTRDGLGVHEPAALIDDGYVLPGLPSLFSALGGARIAPDTMIAETVLALRAALA
jgi:hypothetical protein